MRNSFKEKEKTIIEERDKAIKAAEYVQHCCLIIVSRGDQLGNPANIKVENNGAVGYVGSSLTVHSPFCIFVD